MGRRDAKFSGQSLIGAADERRARPRPRPLAKAWWRKFLPAGISPIFLTKNPVMTADKGVGGSLARELLKGPRYVSAGSAENPCQPLDWWPAMPLSPAHPRLQPRLVESSEHSPRNAKKPGTVSFRPIARCTTSFLFRHTKRRRGSFVSSCPLRRGHRLAEFPLLL